MTYSYNVQKGDILPALNGSSGMCSSLTFQTCITTLLATTFMQIITTNNSGNSLCTFFRGGLTFGQTLEKKVTTNGQVLDCTPAGAATPTPCVSSTCPALSPPTNFDTTAIGPVMSAITVLVNSSDLCNQSFWGPGMPGSALKYGIASAAYTGGTFASTVFTPPTCKVNLQFDYLSGLADAPVTLSTGGTGFGGYPTADDCNLITTPPALITDINSNACPFGLWNLFSNVTNTTAPTCEALQQTTSCNAPCNVASITMNTGVAGGSAACGTAAGSYDNTKCCIHLNTNGPFTTPLVVDYIVKCHTGAACDTAVDCPSSATIYNAASASFPTCASKTIQALDDDAATGVGFATPGTCGIGTAMGALASSSTCA